MHPLYKTFYRLPTANTLFAALLLGGLVACGNDSQPQGNEDKAADKATTESPAVPDPRRLALSEQSASLFGPLPAQVAADNTARIDLGRKLFFEPRLSRDQDISCNSCHNLNTHGVDHEPTSPGHQGQRGERNSPTVYNAGLHTSQFWDGRAADLTEQAKGPILNPVEMAMQSEGMLVTRLASIPDYVALFEAAFPEDKPALSYDNIARAIASFEEGLLTPDRFDAFMQGDLEALSEPEINGLELFIQTGCASCHSGPALGGTMFQKMGLVKPYETEDLGRYNVTKQDQDKKVFKVPSLRNISRTRPYFHDGSITRLVDAIRLMADHQLGKSLTDADIASIAMFLESLTGTPDANYISKPELPAETVNNAGAGAS